MKKYICPIWEKEDGVKWTENLFTKAHNKEDGKIRPT
jgi:hypothetical protein